MSAPLLLLLLIGGLLFFSFTIAAFMDGKSATNKGKVIRNIYFYLASLITLGITIGSLLFLLTLGLQSWVFTKAEPVFYRIGSPPPLYLGSKTAPVGEEVLTCQEGCELTESQRNEIEIWLQNYQHWQERKNNPGAERASDAVSAFSFLIIALPIYLIHYRIVQRDARRNSNGEADTIRSTYFYLVSLGALLMVVIGGGILLNLALQTWVFPRAGDNNKKISYISEPFFLGERSGIIAVLNCTDSCKLSEETKKAAEQWLVDYDQWRKEMNSLNNTHRQAAATIPFVVLGIPLFWYHWRTVRRERSMPLAVDNVK